MAILIIETAVLSRDLQGVGQKSQTNVYPGAPECWEVLTEYKEFLSYTLTENGDVCLSLLCELIFHFVIWMIHWTASHKQKSGTPTERKTQSWQEQRVVTYPIWASTWR